MDELELKSNTIEEFDVSYDTSNSTGEEDTTNYKYTEVDKLDEDEPIQNQMYYIASFVSPEGVMNCKVRGLKIRGVFPNMDEANKYVEKLKKKDKYFDIYIGEVGKWNPWNADANQVDAVKYRNKKLDKIMSETHKQKQQEKDLNTLNELVGRTKQIVTDSKVNHKKRVTDSIKTTAELAASNQISTEDKTEVKKVSKSHTDSTVVRDRLKQMIEKKKLANANKVELDLDSKKELIKIETERLFEAEKSTKQLSDASRDIQEKLNKMKEAYNKSKTN